MNTNAKILADRLAILETLDLKHGSHSDFSKGICALEAVAWLAGEEHSDSPECACPVIATIVRGWNDTLPDDEHRNRLIRPLVAKLVGTKAEGTPAQRDSILLKRMFIVQDWYVRVRTPALLRLAGLNEHAAKLEAKPAIVDLASLEACTEDASAAYSAARSAAENAARSAARSAAENAAESAAYSAAYSATYSALLATVNELHRSFAEVISRMCEVTS